MHGFPQTLTVNFSACIRTAVILSLHVPVITEIQKPQKNNRLEFGPVSFTRDSLRPVFQKLSHEIVHDRHVGLPN